MSPYFIKEPAAISFSGGRTSAYMLYKILDAHGGALPDYVHVLFANTGREMPETLDFVNKVAENWMVDIVWLERWARAIPDESKKYGNRFEYDLQVTNYKDASRDGEPFERLIKSRAYAPNPVARFCTVELKIRAITDYMRRFVDDHYVGYIGIRADEQRRAAKMHGTKEGIQERYLPLWLDGVTKYDVFDFWDSCNFDLELPNNNGTTDWGNCDLCFLKGRGKKETIIRERPDLADWWIRMEEELSEQVGKGAYFRSDHPPYKDMKLIATTQGQLFDFDDESIPCFCGD